MAANEEIKKELGELLEIEDIKACMVANRGLDGITPPAEEIDDLDFWKLMRKATDKLFPLIQELHDYDLEKIYLEIQDYEVSLSVLNEDTVLLVIYPQLSNKGLIEVEIENTRQEILDLFYGN